MQNLVEEDRRVTTDEITNAVGISHGSAFSILTEDLHLSKLSACWVPKALQENQLNQRADLSLAILTKMKQMKPFFSSTVSLDMKHESINLIQKTKFNQEWHPKGAPGPVKFKAERSVKKVMDTIFWDCKGVILIEFLEVKKTVTSSYHKEILKTPLAKKCPGKLHSQILFHHDNALLIL